MTLGSLEGGVAPAKAVESERCSGKRVTRNHGCRQRLQIIYSVYVLHFMRAHAY